MSESNQARKLKFGVLLATCIIFFCLGASRIYATCSLFGFWTPIISETNRGRNRNLVR